MKKITIIGGGATGILLAVNLIKKSSGAPLEINLIEKKERFGRGIAYSTDTDFHLLNVPAAKMGAFPEDIEHFHRWLDEKNYNYAPTGFVPRRIYGEYLRDIFQTAVETKNPAVAINIFDDEAVNVSSDENGVNVSLAAGDIISSDQIVLAFGNFPPPHPKLKNQSFVNAEKYFPNPWKSSNFEKLNSHDEVLVIGNGLTGIDVILSLFHKKHQGKIYAFSTHGILPAVHKSSQTYPDFSDELKSQSKVTELFKIVRRHIKKAAAEGKDWRGVIDSLRPQTQTIWQNLSEAEQKFFLHRLSRYWNAARHRMPPECAKILDDLQAVDKLQILKGRLQQIEFSGNRFSLEYLSEGRENQFKVDAIFNCMGSESNLARLDSPLIKNLLAKGFIKPDRLRLGIDATPEGKIIAADGKIFDKILTTATALKGILWESTAMPEIRQQAQQLAQQILAE